MESSVVGLDEVSVELLELLVVPESSPDDVVVFPAAADDVVVFPAAADSELVESFPDVCEEPEVLVDSLLAVDGEELF